MENVIKHQYSAIQHKYFCQTADGIFYHGKKQQTDTDGSAHVQKGCRVFLYVHKRQKSIDWIFLPAPVKRITIHIRVAEQRKKNNPNPIYSKILLRCTGSYAVNILPQQ